jgi:hypothetical protein
VEVRSPSNCGGYSTSGRGRNKIVDSEYVQSVAVAEGL